MPDQPDDPIHYDMTIPPKSRDANQDSNPKQQSDEDKNGMGNANKNDAAENNAKPQADRGSN